MQRIVIRAKDLTGEDLYFQEQDKKKCEELRAKAAKESDKAYREAHENHCFRCGTKSLVEVDYRDIRIDLCVNEGCGAIHLDPGELEKVFEGVKGVLGKVRNSLFSVFK